MPSVLNKALKIGEFHGKHSWRARPGHFPPLFSTLANIACCIANLGMRVLTRFLAAATDAAQFPAPSIPEIAFLGRSNVGKSSVINSLVGTKLARTSSTPGRTRSINFFEIRWPGKPRPELIFADLPGYGYAKISREISQEWPKFIEPYLQQRPTLALCIALVDVNVPAQQSDRQLLDFLSSTGRDFVVVGTKSDRLSNNQLNNALRALGAQYPSARLLAFSSKTGSGREELWKQIREVAQAKVTAEAPASDPEN
jgi:GTP-binding protein